MKRLSLLLLPILLLSCSSEPKQGVTDTPTVAEKKTPANIELKKGEVTHGIPCGNGQTYDLYLPSNYNNSASWAVLFAFDPQGDGSLPLEKYKSLAEEFDVVMVGSNYSKNGLEFNLIKQHYQDLKRDLESRVNTDKSRFYMLGFSGGAKVATQLGLGDNSVQGVIACGAATKFQKPEKTLLYTAIAGMGDFNYPSMFYSYQVMKKMGVPYVFQTFAGKHEWAPEENVAQALRWLNLLEMKNQNIPPDKDLINKWKRTDEAQIGKIAQSDDLAFYTTYTNLVEMYDGLADVSSYKEAIKRMETSGRANEALKKFEKILQGEESQKAYYMKALNSQNMAWWTKEVNRLKQDQNQAKGEAKHSVQRALGFLGLAVYMQASSAVDKNKNQEAGKLVSIYLLIEPENPEAHYLNAILSARTGDNQGALKALQEAKKHNLTNTERLQTQAEFEALRGMDGFKELL